MGKAAPGTNISIQVKIDRVEGDVTVALFVHILLRYFADLVTLFQRAYSVTLCLHGLSLMSSPTNA